MASVHLLLPETEQSAEVPASFKCSFLLGGRSDWHYLQSMISTTEMDLQKKF